MPGLLGVQSLANVAAGLRAGNSISHLAATNLQAYFIFS
jgi:hypothetical protein